MSNRNTPILKLTIDGKNWQLIYGPIDTCEEADKVAAPFKRSGIAVRVETDPNGLRYMYRDAEGFIESLNGYTPKPRTEGVLKALSREFGDIRGIVFRARTAIL